MDGVLPLSPEPCRVGLAAGGSPGYVPPPMEPANDREEGVTPSPTVQHPDRRGFLGFLPLLLGALPTVGGLLAALRTGAAPAGGKPPERIALCRLEEVPDEGILEVAVSYKLRSGPLVESVGKVVFVTKDPESGEVLALAGECTHLSCPVQDRVVSLDGDGDAPLSCPCHGGAFSRTGEVLGGPPDSPLRRLRLAELPTSESDTIYLLEV